MAESPPPDRLRTLLDQLEQARERLEETDDSDSAVDILQDIANLAKETQVELERVRREAAAEGS